MAGGILIIAMVLVGFIGALRGIILLLREYLKLRGLVLSPADKISPRFGREKL